MKTSLLVWIDAEVAAAFRDRVDPGSRSSVVNAFLSQFVRTKSSDQDEDELKAKLEACREELDSVMQRQAALSVALVKIRQDKAKRAKAMDEAVKDVNNLQAATAHADPLRRPDYPM